MSLDHVVPPENLLMLMEKRLIGPFSVKMNGGEVLVFTAITQIEGMRLQSQSPMAIAMKNYQLFHNSTHQSQTNPGALIMLLFLAID